jgi:hypothetical protein
MLCAEDHVNMCKYFEEIGTIKGCSVAQLVVRWLAVKQARVRNSMEDLTTEPAAVKDV